MSKWWKEKWINDMCFYCGVLSKGDIRLGLSIGNECGNVDLFFFTFGYMK